MTGRDDIPDTTRDEAVREALWRLALAVEHLAEDVGGRDSYVLRLASDAMNAVLNVPSVSGGGQ